MKQENTVDGFEVIVIQGKERQEDNTEAVCRGVEVGRTSSEGLMLIFRGEGVLGSFPALELCDRLDELKSAGKRVVTMAQSWLGAPDLLLWLQGTERLMTASGYGHVKVPSWSKHVSYEAQKASTEDPDHFWEELHSPEEARLIRQRLENPRNYAYEKMLDRLNEFFPVVEYVNKVVPRFDLADLGLITGEGFDKYLLENLNDFKSISSDLSSKGYVRKNSKL
jgi:hypothetical protein